MLSNSFSDKTVFVLNHTQSFSKNSGDELTLDSGLKSANQSSIFKKSIWNNAVEAVLQYCRVVFDLFSSQKPISIITFDDEEKIHSIWLDEDQNLETLWNIFCQEGPPKASVVDNSNDLLPGLGSACNMLQMLTPMQSDFPQRLNHGRVIFLSTCTHHYAVTASEWVFIDLTPDALSEIPPNSSPIPINVPTSLHMKNEHRFLYHKLQPTSEPLYQGMMRLAETHYNLASTLVQDIPMKEEANTSSGSSMYGVELLHSAKVHHLIDRMGLTSQMWLRSGSEFSRPNSGFSRTLGIKWVTPKASDSTYLRFAVGAFRVTLADVCNRASACLAQFVLGGRSVALAHRVPLSFPALPKDNNQFALISTDEALLLTCHGSVMYLHVLSTICPLAHPPLIRLQTPEPTNYRVQAFIDQILRPSRLAPASARLDYTVLPKDRARQHLERLTRYWPLGDSQTLLGKNKSKPETDCDITDCVIKTDGQILSIYLGFKSPYKLADPLFEHLPKEYLEPNELTACEEAVSSIVNSIKQQVSLSDTRKSSSKRTVSLALPIAPSVQAEAIALATELDYFLSLYSDLSAEHEQIRHHWIQSLKSIKSDFDLGTPRTCSEDRFASLGLSEMVRMARLAACDKTESVEHSVPAAVTKTLRELTVLCERLHSGFGTNGQKVPNTSRKRPHPDTGLQNAPLIEPANLAAFKNLLQPAKRSRSQQGKPDFVGISTADAKGVCQLYKSLKDKEKSAS